MAEQATGQTGSVGMGIPGSISPYTGVVKNANSTWLNGQPFDKDLSARLQREVRLANDANCLAVSEAIDGALQFWCRPNQSQYAQDSPHYFDYQQSRSTLPD